MLKPERINTRSLLLILIFKTFTIRAFLATILIISFTAVLQADVVTVKQDGTGDYTTIEAAMNESVWNVGDTVLVWPGIYYEHIYYYGNHITVASLYAINSDPWYINNTIIDGNQSGGCVNMKYGNDDLIINGFTIRNGIGMYGGGIYINEASGVVRNCTIESNSVSKYGGGICIDDASAEVSNCIIKNNTSSMGGGIYTIHANLFLSGTTVKFNHARGMGGGIVHGYQSYISYDTNSKCNLFLNYGAPGTDYYKFYEVPPQTIVFDTCTVDNPGTFFIASYDMNGYPVNNVTVLSEHAYLEQINHDLYVDPLSGDNGNSGISINDPLKTIAFASILIESDNLNPHTICLSNGLYSSSTNNEKIPFCIKNYVSLVGESMDSTIIDADSLSYFMMGLGYSTNFSVENITFQNGKGGFHFFNNDLVSIKNVNLKNSINGGGGIEINNVDSLIIKNTTVKNFQGAFAISIGCWYGNNTSFHIENCVIEHNGPGVNTTYSHYRGGAIEIRGQEQSFPSELGFGIISNVQITDNVRRYEPELSWDKTVALDISGYYKIDLINSNIAGNILNGPNGSITGFGTSASSGAELNIYNSILFNHSLWELLLGGGAPYNDPTTIRVYYSDIEGGQNGVINWNLNNTLHWGSGNMDSNPQWDTTAATPYALPWNSPCRNTGTPPHQLGMSVPYIIQEDSVYKLVTVDIDTITLPATDLAGNPRIVGERIDMGAYECQETTTRVAEHFHQISNIDVEVNPNPFYSNTLFSFNLVKNSKVLVIIYDMKGNMVKRLVDDRLPAGMYNLAWSGGDNNDQKISNGIYLVSLIVNGKYRGAEKVVKRGNR